MRWTVVIAGLLVPVLAHAETNIKRHKAVCNGPNKRCFAHVVTDVQGKFKADVAPSGFGAPDLVDAYKIPVDVDPGATIAIVDAFGYPTLEADLAAYRTQFGLPPCTIANGCLTIVNQAGQTSPLPAASNDPQDDWTFETALDIDMASAGCPKCKILVVQATSDRDDGLDIANNTAAALGASVISNSWGGPESADADVYYTHPGIAIFASTGDNGWRKRASYPAASPNVIAVGGTTLVKNSASPRGWAETAWADGGSGCSSQAAKPSWQTKTDGVCNFRSTADVSAVGDPATGVAVYNNGHWGVVGGTSASSPLVAAIYAVTKHSAEISKYAYEHTQYFFDVPSGSNGTCGNILCTAGDGWDGPTGIGTPNAGAIATNASAPTVTVDPPSGANVDKGFTITATCTPTDGAQVMRVDILIDNLPFAPLTAPPYTAEVVATRFPKAGPHTITATCTMSSLLKTSTTNAITTVDACAVPSDCPTATDGCFDAHCYAGTDANNGLGATCTGNDDCASTMCAVSPTESHCAISCAADSTCPDGFTCTSNVCWPAATDGGGCSAGGQAPGWLLLGLGATLVRRRRRS